MELAKDRGYVFVPAEQTAQGIETIDRLVALLGTAPGVGGFVLEYADDAACPEVIGALSAADSRAVLSDLVCVVDLIAPEAHRFVLDGNSVHEPVYWDFGQRPPSAGWTALLNSEFFPPDHAERAIGFRYEQARPFHPQRLQAVLVAALGEGRWGRIVRSAGFARLASRPYVAAHWDQTGTRLMLAPLTAGPYLGEGAELLALGQELAFIGIDLDEAGLIEALERVVLTDAELLAVPTSWLEYPDDFPAWDSAHRG